jgi:cell cycle checkpoint protein
MAPQAKRRKRAVVESDDEESDATPRKNSLQNFLFSSPSSKKVTSPIVSPTPARKSTRSTAASNANNDSAGNKSPTKRPASDSLNGTPEKKSKGAKKQKVEEKGKSGNLLALFSKQSQKAQAINGKKPQSSIPLEAISSDPISEEDEFADHKAFSSSFVGKKAQKRFKDNDVASTSSSFSSTAGQKFLVPPRLTSSSSVDDDLRPWSERFAPTNLDELAVHKKKVADVRKWLHDVVGGRMRQRLLVLKGAAGTAKTTTVQLLAKEMGREILEWRNPTGALGAASSTALQFDDFMLRGGRFGQLEVDLEPSPADDDTEYSNESSSYEPVIDENKQQLILIEEFPNTFARSSNALAAFRNTILQYLAMNTPALATFGQGSNDEPIIPVVVIVSEALLSTTSATADSFTAHRLLGPDILRHPSTHVIEFNAIAPSIMSKALEVIVQKEARRSGRRKTPGPQVLKALGEIGDIRSAVSSLEFLCLKGDDAADWGSKIAFSKSKKGTRDVALTKGEEQSLELVSRREATLGIFHAVGKVVYNKRDENMYPEASEGAVRETMPDYMTDLSRPHRSQVCVDSLIDEIGTDTHTFISALHENYILSCERSSPRDSNSSLDYINGCIGYLSESDLLCPSSDIFFGRRGAAGGFGFDTGSHILRQDEMAFQVAVQGLLFSLPFPVKRMATGSAKGGDQFKMFYPTYLKLWRTKEELEGLIEMWASKLLHGELSAPKPAAPHSISAGSLAQAFRKTKSSSVGDWAGNRTELEYMARKKAEAAAALAKAEDDETDAPPAITLGSAARSELLLERLPYMALMSRRRMGASFTLGPADLEKLVSFRGIGGQGNDEDDVSDAEGEDATQKGEAWATDRPTEEGTPRKPRAARIRGRAEESVETALTGGIQTKLVLSDDDIEDD